MTLKQICILILPIFGFLSCSKHHQHGEDEYHFEILSPKNGTSVASDVPVNLEFVMHSNVPFSDFTVYVKHKSDTIFILSEGFAKEYNIEKNILITDLESLKGDSIECIVNIQLLNTRKDIIEQSTTFKLN